MPLACSVTSSAPYLSIMADDELHYLQPGFDLSSLTVPKIREILVSHDISYPSSAKKPQLIQILTDELLPKARKLLNARARTKRTSRGIQDMPSSQESSTIGGDDDQDGELMPPPPPPKTPRGRKSKASLAAQAAAEEGDIPATPATARRARTPGRQKSTSKHPRASDTETEPERPPPSARKTRKSTPGPVPVEHTHSVKIEEPDHRIKRESLENGASPFSDENPFQSGSSPGSESRRVSSTSRTRKSLGAPSIDRRKSTSTSRRRQTTSPTQAGQEDQYDVPSRSTFEFPVARVKSEEAEDAVPTTEEFTPEEQLELSRDRAAQGYSASESIPTRSRALVRRKKKPTSTAVKSAPVVVLTTVLAAIGAWYRKEKVEVGYCGVGKPSWSLADNPQIPGWVHETLQPQCEPCPQHAYCYPGMEVACETNYVLQPHPLSLGGAVPLPPTCEPDGEKVKRIKAVADKAIEELRDRRAIYECGDEFKPTAAESSAPVDVKTVVKGGEMKLEIAEEDLKKEVGKQRRKGMSGEEFEDLWQSALGDIMERDEVEVTKDGYVQRSLNSPICLDTRHFLTPNPFQSSSITICLTMLVTIRSDLLTW